MLVSVLLLLGVVLALVLLTAVAFFSLGAGDGVLLRAATFSFLVSELLSFAAFFLGAGVAACSTWGSWASLLLLLFLPSIRSPYSSLDSVKSVSSLGNGITS